MRKAAEKANKITGTILGQPGPLRKKAQPALDLRPGISYDGI
jgi:hypothetical protein